MSLQTTIKEKLTDALNIFRLCQAVITAVKDNEDASRELSTSVTELTKTINTHFSDILSKTGEHRKEDLK